MNRIQEPGVSVPKSYKGIYLAFFKLSFLKAQFTQMYRNFLKKGVVSALFNFFFFPQHNTYSENFQAILYIAVKEDIT